MPDGKDRFVCCAKKRKKNATSNFCVCVDPNDLRRKSPGYIGKLRSNTLGTKFMMFDSGECEEKSSKQTLIRTQLEPIIFETNLGF